MTERDSLFLAHILPAIADIENLSPALIADEMGVPWRQIAGARDRLIHAYFNVDLDAVWSMVEQDWPDLRANVQRILALGAATPG